MRIKIGPGVLEAKYPADLDVVAVKALHGKPPTAVFQKVTLCGEFGDTGIMHFTGYRAFDCAIVKANCDVIVMGHLQRFAGEMVVNPSSGATAWRPDLGWAPMLVASMDTLQLQGRPGDGWIVNITAIPRPPDTEKGKELEAEGKVVPCPTHDGEVIVCDKYTEEGRQRL